MREFCVVLIAIVVSGGCQQPPVSQGPMIIGDVVGDADVDNKRDRLGGRGVQVSDAFLGPRAETFVDVNNPRREFVIYPVKRDGQHGASYVVELNSGRVRAISKQRNEAQGAVSALGHTTLEQDLFGKSPQDCADRFGPPLVLLRSRDNGDEIGIYDMTGLQDLGGTWCGFVRFDFDRRCKQVNLVSAMVAKPTEE